MAAEAPPQRFMLIGAARTGSNYVSSLLSAHPSIRMRGEIFNLDTLPQKALLEALDDPVKYLRGRIYDEGSSTVAGIGFKMFYDHLTPAYFDKPINLSQAAPRLRDKIVAFEQFVNQNYDRNALEERFRAAWEVLIADRSLRVIHLKRRNLLETFVSLKMAFATEQWWSLQRLAAPRPQLSLEFDECRRFFERMHASMHAAEAAFSSHPYLELAYEEVAAAEQQEMDKVFEFLAVGPQPVVTVMRKQITDPMPDVVTNYRDLKNAFAATEWSGMFA